MSGYSIPRVNDVDPHAATGAVLVLMQGGQKCRIVAPVSAPDTRRDYWRSGPATEGASAAGACGLVRKDDEAYQVIIRDALADAGARYGVDPALLRKPCHWKLTLLNDARSHALAVCTAEAVPARLVAPAFGITEQAVWAKRSARGK